MNSGKGQKRLSSLIVNGTLLLIVIIWTIPTMGIFVSSFRNRDDISTSGWWKVFPYRDWQAVQEIDPKAAGLDPEGIMTIEGVSGTFDEFRARTGYTILERYGMTETGMNTSNPVDGPRLAGTVGLPLPGVAVRIVDERNQPVKGDTVGMLQVKGANVFRGYWRMPDKTAEEFTADGFFITGDLAKYNAQGYISIVGRNKDMVITGGYNVYPKEIELLLDEIDGVRESAVIGLPHKDFGEAVTAVIVPEDMNRLPDEKAIIGQLREKLANYKVPKRIFVVEQLPRNTMGKVQKNVLREQYK